MTKELSDIPRGLRGVYGRFQRWRNKHPQARLPIPKRLWLAAGGGGSRKRCGADGASTGVGIWQAQALGGVERGGGKGSGNQADIRGTDRADFSDAARVHHRV